VFESEIAPIKQRLQLAGVERLGVFGSVARGTATPGSDVDVLVRFRPDAQSYDNLFEVGEALEQAFHRPVDLVTEPALSPYLGPHILKEVQYVDLND
jgi:predicted nucleotidyltransferase